MAHIIIKNVGPIKKVELDLNKINVFMGPQSSGKSTIAKIISYCSWYEKNTILKTKLEKNFYKELLSFHNLEDSYFSSNSYIEYKTDNCSLFFSGKNRDKVDGQITLNSDDVFLNKKIEYIPAERNFVTIKGIGNYSETRDNILNFLTDWFEAKESIKEDTKYRLPLKSLGSTSFFYDKDNLTDNIVLNDEKVLSLRHASSGLMSVTPMLVIFNYITKGIYEKKRIQSPFEIINIQSKIDILDNQNKKLFIEMKKMMDGLQEWINTHPNSESVQNKADEYQKKINRIIGIDTDYNYSEIIIEEPELNLFPDTQRDVIYYMLSVLNEDPKNHQLVITTHSPYILFSLNNCMMGGLVKDKIPEEKRNEFESYHSWIDPKKVSIYEIHDGELKPIQDEDGIIEDNYLNKAYKENSAEYLSLLNYYDDEE